MANQSIGLSNLDLINVQLCEVKLFDTITPKQLAEYQKMFMNASQTILKPKLTAIHGIKLKPIRRLLLQYD